MSNKSKGGTEKPEQVLKPIAANLRRVNLLLTEIGTCLAICEGQDINVKAAQIKVLVEERMGLLGELEYESQDVARRRAEKKAAPPKEKKSKKKKRQK